MNNWSDCLSRSQSLFDQGRFPEAAEALAAALQADPDNPELRLMRAKLDYVGGRIEPARTALLQLVGELPDSLDAHHLLGAMLSNSGHVEEAVRLLERAYQLSPDDPQVCSNLGAALVKQSHFNLAEPYLLKARDLDPASPEVRNNLGIMYLRQLKSEDAVREYRQAVAQRPGNLFFRNSLVRAEDYCLHINHREHFRTVSETGDWIQKISPGLFDSYAEQGETIRLGYIASTLRQHSVAYFTFDIFANHAEQFEVFCYHVGEQTDWASERIADSVDHFRHLPNQSPEAIARQIHSDGIHILIDLEGFSGKDFILNVLAHGPAPLQVSYLGWPATTGLSRVEYRFVDHFTDPVDSIADDVYTEKLLRMSESFAVYSPLPEAPEVQPAPCLVKGTVTFGSFNWPIKMCAEVIDLWSAILQSVPRSRLMIKHGSLDQQSMRDNIHALFLDRGIASERLELIPFEADVVAHLARYHDIDIALDPFPFNGMTTSCEALWMGVPLVTLAGEKHLSRVGVSLLNNIGHPEWIATDYARYQAIAVDLAGDPDRLNRIRQALRSRMRASPLMDGRKFTAEFERNLLNIWHGRT